MGAAGLLAVAACAAPAPAPSSLSGDTARRHTIGDWSTTGHRVAPGADYIVDITQDSGQVEAWAHPEQGPATLTLIDAAGVSSVHPLAAGEATWISAPVAAGPLVARADPPVVLGGVGWAPVGRDPALVLVILIDTLRADRLGAWGHDRPTSPHIDALAAQGRRFDDALAPAPWTLPSTRGLLSGRQPEARGPGLQQDFSAAGWLTAAVVANPWLGAPHGLADGWGWHGLFGGAAADAQVDRALALLQVSTGRDRLLLVHLQDPHLPYREPEPYRSRWAGPPPEGLEGPFTGRTLRALPPLPVGDARRTFVSDRYDQNVAWTDAQVGRLMAAVPPEATVVLASDHGEELWEHRGVEHGHALHAELTRVPLVVRAPGLAPGGVTAPVSLLDVAPTLRRMHGLPADPDTAGIDLTGPIPADRRRVTGRLLYGPAGWRVDGSRGWVQSHGGALTTSTGAATLDQAADFRSALGAALGVAVPAALRVARPGVAAGTSSSPASSVSLVCPGGFSTVWAEPRPLVERTPPWIDGDRLSLPRARGSAPTGEALVVPQDPAADCILQVDDPAAGPAEATVPAGLAPGDPAIRVGPRGRAATVDRVWMPRLGPDAHPTGGDAEALQALQEIGYIEPEGGSHAPPTSGEWDGSHGLAEP